MRTALLLIMGVAIGLGCRDATRAAIETKCDASLRQRAEELSREGRDEPLDVLGRCDGPIDEARRAKLAAAGATLGQVTDELFTAQIPVHRMGDVAVLPFVTSLQLSQTREPLNPVDTPVRSAPEH
jgi:hypothetical protein